MEQQSETLSMSDDCIIIRSKQLSKCQHDRTSIDHLTTSMLVKQTIASKVASVVEDNEST
jgi:hypothetical protein